VLKQLNQLRAQGGPAAAPAPAAANVSPPPASAAPRPAAAPKAERSPAAPTTERRPPTRPEPPATQPPAAVEPPAPVAPVPAAGNLPGLWSSLVEAVGRVSPFTRGYLIDAHPVSFEKGVLVIGFDPEFEDHLGLVDNSRNHTLLATKLAELGHPNSMIKFIKAEAPAGWVRQSATYAPAPATAPARPAAATAPATAPAKSAETAPASTAAPEKKTAAVPFSKEDFKNDPLIQKALEVFKGTIIEVRA